MGKTKLLGRLGVWLCNRYQPRPLTKVEIAESQQYVQLMIDVLRGEVSYYGRDRKFGTGCGEMSELATVAERARELVRKLDALSSRKQQESLIEQALLAERRLARTDTLRDVEQFCRCISCCGQRAVIALRAAAEKELGAK